MPCHKVTCVDFAIQNKLFPKDGFLTVGSLRPDNIKVELFDFDQMAWETMDDYPYGSSKGFGCHDMVYIQESTAYYVIGGLSSPGEDSEHTHSTIAKFHNGVWSQAGQLNQSRHVSPRFLKPFKTPVLRHIELNG